MKIQNALVSNILDRSQRYFAHVTTVTLSWRVQNIVVIGRVNFTLECFEFSSNFEFDRNICLVGRAPDQQFSICYTCYKGNRAVTLSGELYFVTTGVTIGASTGHWIGPRVFGLRYTWTVRHHRITIPKDCLTGRNSIITGLIYRNTVSRSDTPGQWYIWILCEIFLDCVLETSHYWTLTDHTGHWQISAG